MSIGLFRTSYSLKSSKCNISSHQLSAKKSSNYAVQDNACTTIIFDVCYELSHHDKMFNSNAAITQI